MQDNVQFFCLCKEMRGTSSYAREDEQGLKQYQQAQTTLLSRILNLNFISSTPFQRSVSLIYEWSCSRPKSVYTRTREWSTVSQVINKR